MLQWCLKDTLASCTNKEFDNNQKRIRPTFDPNIDVCNLTRKYRNKQYKKKNIGKDYFDNENDNERVEKDTFHAQSSFPTSFERTKLYLHTKNFTIHPG